MSRTIFCLLFLTSTVSTGWATDYYVSTTGNDNNSGTSTAQAWKTLAKAFASVQANQGHTIRVGAGTFSENAILTVPSGVNITGAGVGNTIITGSSATYYALQQPIYNTHHDKFLLQLPNGKNQTLSQFTLEGANHQIHGAIFAPGTNNVHFVNLAVKHFNYGGIYVARSTDVEIGQSVFVDNGFPNTEIMSSGSNIFYFGDTRLSIHDCDINQIAPEARDGSYGIRDIHPDATDSGNYYNLPGELVTELKIWNTSVRVSSMGAWNNWSSPGITIESNWCPVLNCEIRNCQVNNSISLTQGRGGSSGQSWRVHHNLFDMWDIAYGIEVNTNYIEIDHNYMRGGVYPFAQWDEGNRNKSVTMHHNTILYDVNVDNLYSLGLYLSWGGCDDLAIYNNTLVYTNRAYPLLKLWGKGLEKPWGNLQIKNNVFVNQTGTAVNVLANGSYTGTVDRNVFRNVNTLGTNAYTSSPGLTLSGNKPFPYFAAISQSSFVVDKGGVIAGITDGFAGAAPDLGASEYGVAPWQVGIQNSSPPVADPLVTAQGDNAANNEGIDKIHDGNLNSKWLHAASTSWVQFKYSAAKVWNKYDITSGNDEPGRDPRNWTLLGSNTGADGSWVTLDTQSGQSWSGRNQTRSFTFTNNTAYQYYRWVISATNGAPILQASELTFSFSSALENNAIYEIESALAAGKVLDVAGGNSTPGTKVQLWTSNASNAQRWKAVDVGSGYYKLIPQNATGTAMDIANSGTADGSQVQIYTDNGTGAQKYKLADAGGGYFTIQPSYSTTSVLDISGSSTTDGAKVQLWAANNSPAQKFKFIKRASGGRLSAEPVSVETEMIVYPNPSGTYLTIRYGDSTDAMGVTFYNVGGQVTHNQQARFNTPINIEKLTPGLYILKVQTGQHMHTLKVLKQ
ncbi:RICIN domain-containing protein [uncultured Fibrella sp.]|uniref:RICIN domain-containing protein n=1 Tax=uncultured Fibrella sp. TaxID=1284596 RepID=UPI0035CA2AAD